MYSPFRRARADEGGLWACTERITTAHSGSRGDIAHTALQRRPWWRTRGGGRSPGSPVQNGAGSPDQGAGAAGSQPAGQNGDGFKVRRVLGGWAGTPEDGQRLRQRPPRRRTAAAHHRPRRPPRSFVSVCSFPSQPSGRRRAMLRLTSDKFPVCKSRLSAPAASLPPCSSLSRRASSPQSCHLGSLGESSTSSPAPFIALFPPAHRSAASTVTCGI